MSQAIGPLTALLLAVAILVFGNGLQGVLLPVRATLEAFATTSIGLIAAAYSVGFMVGCLSMPHIVRRHAVAGRSPPGRRGRRCARTCRS